MYEQFYGFRERPFQLTPDPQYMFLTQQHRSGLTLLEYSLSQQATVSLITGEVGCGKTTLIRYLLERLEKDITIGLISNTSHAFERMLPWVALALGQEFRNLDDTTLYDNLTRFLIEEYAAGRQVVLIVDEAQNLSHELLEELRVFSNINADKHVVLQIILVGQPELRDMVRGPNMRQLAQRIGIDYHIEPLNAEESRFYIWHRLRVAGGKVKVFRKEAIDMVISASAGVPRLINQLCDAALVYGFAERQQIIEWDLMRQVIEDRTRGGVFPASADGAVRGVL